MSPSLSLRGRFKARGAESFRDPPSPLDGAGEAGRYGGMSEPIDCPSPNFDARKLPITIIVLHYTGMVDAAAAIAGGSEVVKMKPEAKLRMKSQIVADAAT